MLSQLVETVLSALGMPQLINDSRGLIQINNWKPLAFETITDNQDELVNNLFKEISSNIVLKILTKQSPDSQNTQCITDLQQKLLKIAIEKQPQILTSLDNQGIKEIIQQVISTEDPPHLSKEQIQAINDWLEAIGQDDSRKSPISTTRFSHVSELPKLERWFRTDPNPSRQKLIGYMNILNNAPYRKSNNKVTYQQICNWFSNQRSSSRSRQTSSTTITSSAPIFASLAAKNEAIASSSENIQIPITNPPIDIRAKFLANGFSSMVERQNDTERIDGGSESPTGNDDISEHSNSENGYDALDAKRESLASSPEMAMDMSTPSMVPLSPKNSLQTSSAASSAAMATIAAAFSSMNNVANNALAAQLSQHFGISGLGSAPSPSPSLNGVSTSNGGTNTPNGSGSNSNANNASNASNIARSRLMFDPLSELPILERWFEENPHPGWLQIEQYTEILNSLQYRQNYPPISTHNVKIWFKNRRAKCKRLLTNDGKVPINV
uniref:Homeobox domain-containing protein n=1 Tax=Acrobeloides nanus TaxID=290746 RepID=A0A914CC46_9BILA